MNNNHINYVELKARNLEEVKDFYSRAFGWKFVDYGPDYVAFSESGLEGGFERSDEEIVNGTLIVLYHENLESAKANIEAANGTEMSFACHEGIIGKPVILRSITYF